MSAVEDIIDRELHEAEARVRAANTPLEKVNAEYRRLIAIADESAAAAVEAESRREGLLLKKFRGDDVAAALLANIEPFATSNRQNERDARDAAALLKPEIDALTLESQRAARAVMELRHRRVVDVREQASSAVHEALAALFRTVDAYKTAAGTEAESHRALYHEPPARYGHESPTFRAARLLAIEIRRRLGDDGVRALAASFQLTDGTL